MKKLILLITFVAITVFSFAQKIDSIDCNGITKKVDEFNEEIIFHTPLRNDVNFCKIIKTNGVIIYSLHIWIEANGIYNGNGVIIILKNGKRINKPNTKVESSYFAGSFYTQTYFQLTNEDIVLLKESGIAKYKLYISTGDITDYSDISKDFFNCLIKAK